MTATDALRAGRWPAAPMGSVTERIFVGLPTSRYAAKAGESSITVPVLSVGDIEDGRLAEPRDISRLALRSSDIERFRVRRGDVLLSCRGTVLKAAAVLEDMGETFASSNLITIRPAPAIMLPQLILALLRSPTWQETLRSRTRSSTALMQLTVKDVEDLFVPVPPMAVQTMLAEVIDTGERAYRTAIEAASLRRALVESTVARALLDSAPESTR